MLDYRDNKNVISRVYREAYIARSRKMNNLKSLSMLRKNRAADFQHFLKQTVQQLNSQPRRGLRAAFDPKPIISTKQELSELTRRHHLGFREERVATAERTRSQNPTMSNRSVTPQQDLMITPQMPSGTKIASKKNITISCASSTPFVNDIAHSRMQNKNLMSAKAEPPSEKRNSDLAEIQVAGKKKMAKKVRAGSSYHQKSSRACSRLRHQSGKSRPVTESLDQEGILQEISQEGRL